MRHRMRRFADDARPDVLRAVAIGHVVDTLAVGCPHRPILARAAAGQPLEGRAGAVPAAQPDLRLVDVAVADPPPLRAREPAHVEGDRVAARRRCAVEFVEIRLGDVRHRRAATRAHAEDIALAVDVVARRGEVDPAAAPALEPLDAIVVGELRERSGRERQHVDVGRPVAVRDERELRSVGRVERTIADQRVVDQDARGAAGAARGPDASTRDECDRASVGRDGGLRERRPGLRDRQ